MNRTKPLQSHPERFSSFVIDETLGCDLEESIVTPRHDMMLAAMIAFFFNGILVTWNEK
jgi:hypothetical protein